MVNLLHSQPSVGELMDRLAINQLKQLMRPATTAELERDIQDVQHDLNVHLRQGGARLDARTLRLAVAGAQLNWHIWVSKERMQDGEHDAQLKLGHQLNGLRNQVKNALAVAGGRSRPDLKTNTGVDGLSGWTVSALEPAAGAAPVPAPASPSFRAAVNVAESIDALAIAQLKETLFTGPAVAACTRRLAELTHDLQTQLDHHEALDGARVIRLTILLAQLHGVIWQNKDRMQTEDAAYAGLLNEAQEMNGLRNECRNQLLREFGELSAVTERATFLQDHDRTWYGELRAAIRAEAVGAPDFRPVSFADLEQAFGLEFAGADADRAVPSEGDLGYRVLPKAERDQILRQIVQAIGDNQFWVSGSDQQGKWEDGWAENLRRFEATQDLKALIPVFLKKRKIFRFKRDFIEARDADFEFNLIDIYRRRVFQRHFAAVDSIYEFGCGSGQHLPALAQLFPAKQIHGADWAESSLQIIAALRRSFQWKLHGFRFNMFEPDQRESLAPSAGVLTVGAMEQLGSRFEAFLDYLLAQAPQVVVHLETIHELYDDANLLDHLALKYDEKRNYLRGYLARLKALEAERRVEILQVQRAYFGSVHHDGYSLVAWRPVAART
jgi:hypothetical protein